MDEFPLNHFLILKSKIWGRLEFIDIPISQFLQQTISFGITLDDLWLNKFISAITAAFRICIVSSFNAPCVNTILDRYIKIEQSIM